MTIHVSVPAENAAPQLTSTLGLASVPRTTTTDVSEQSTSVGVNETITIAFGIVASLTAVASVVIACVQLKRTQPPGSIPLLNANTDPEQGYRLLEGTSAPSSSGALPETPPPNVPLSGVASRLASHRMRLSNVNKFLQSYLFPMIQRIQGISTTTASDNNDDSAGQIGMDEL